MLGITLILRKRLVRAALENSFDQVAVNFL
jgi:hypothetical protein